ncbi:MAG: hypothetical protein R3B70_29175 [Polyangiaceae bacterium]
MPIISPATVSISSSSSSWMDSTFTSGARSTFAIPQSSKYTSPKSPSTTFAGLMSLCRIARECAYSSARHSEANAVRSLLRENPGAAPRRSSSITSESVTPRTRFIVKYGDPDSSAPMSYTGTIDRCSSCP